MAASRGASVRVVNLREVKATLRRFQGDVEDLKDANAAAARIVAQAASGRAPRRTGRLAGAVRGNRAAGRATVIVATIYAGPIHYGWPARGIEAQPFVTDAADDTRPVWLAAYEADLRRACAEHGA